MYQLSPSILAADFARLGEQLQSLEAAGADSVHIDVMDGCFVPRISFGMPVMESVRKVTSLPFDVHLMVEDPIRFIGDFRACGADMLTVHCEACRHLHTAVLEIKKHGMEAGVALNPATPAEMLRYILPELDYVLVMTVNPGFGGQKFLPSMMDKIRDVRRLMRELGVQADIQVDGGITADKVREVMDAGANRIVAGTSVFRGDIAKNISVFREAFAHADQ